VPDISIWNPIALNLFRPVFGAGIGGGAWTGILAFKRDLALWNRRLYFCSGELGLFVGDTSSPDVIKSDFFDAVGLLLWPNPPEELSAKGDHIAD